MWKHFYSLQLHLCLCSAPHIKFIQIQHDMKKKKKLWNYSDVRFCTVSSKTRFTDSNTRTQKGTYYWTSSDVWLGVESKSHLTADLSHIILPKQWGKNKKKFHRIINRNTGRERIRDMNFAAVTFHYLLTELEEKWLRQLNHVKNRLYRDTETDTRMNT